MMRTLLIFTVVPLLAQVSFGQDGETCTDIAHCDTCPNPEPVCTDCDGGFIENSDGSRCLECPDHCNRCAEHSLTAAECSECDDGFYEHSSGSGPKSCEECPGHCDECEQGDHGGECSECAAGFFLLEDGHECQDCSSNCRSCLSASDCQECSQGFYLASGACQECPGGSALCTSCTGSTMCDVCVTHHYWDADANACAECIDNCDRCDDDVECTECSDNFFLHHDGTCMSASHCSAWTHDGCTACDLQFRLSEDKTCDSCPAFDSITCPTCHSDTQGMTWSVENGECNYCPDNCLSCNGDGTCETCVDGMVWQDGACTACSTAAFADLAHCGTCEGYYINDAGCTGGFDGLAPPECPSGTPTDEHSCDQCRETDTMRGYLWDTGSCLDVDCAQSALTSGACSMCPDTYWDGVDCQDITCASDSLDTQGKCDGCADQRVAYWDPAECTVPSCVGAFDSAETCTYCFHRIWDDINGVCNAVNCYAQLTTEAACNACPGMYWESGVCNEFDCAGAAASTSPLECAACRHLKYAMNTAGSACEVVADCSNTATPSQCNACPGRRHTGLACEVVVCTGTVDSEDKCLGCVAQFWDASVVGAEVCTVLECDSAQSTEATCTACPGQVWDAVGGTCTEYDCYGVITIQEHCASCSALIGYSWDDSTSTCAPADCSSLVTMTTQEECTACEGKWMEGSCEEVDCSVAANMLIEEECSVCAGTMWVADPGVCADLVCDEPLEDRNEELCRKCGESFWENGACIADLECDAAILNTAERCHSCSTEDNLRVYDDSTGSCWVCPEHCASCDNEKCQICAYGYVWDDVGKTCAACEGIGDQALDTNGKCSSCPRRVWHGNMCKHCPDGCVSCSSPNQCDQCATGMMWSAALQQCHDCLLDSTTECLSCGSSMRGRTWHEASEQCHYCDQACAECADGDVCEDCANGYYLTTNDDDTVTCTACAGDPLLRKEACLACGGDDTYWDGTNGVCEDCLRDCMSCTDGDSCDSCDTGLFYSSSANACDDCPRDCLECSSANDCQVCQSDNFYNSEANACVSCPNHCVNCEINGCTACNYGYYLVAGECEACGQGCGVCTNADTCRSCMSNYCLDVDTNTCVQTNSGCTECQVADSTVTCLTCSHGDYLEVCVDCSVAHCTKCDADRSRCAECSGGYYYEELSNRCSECPGGALCMECDGADTCNQCIYRHYSSTAENTCKTCPSHCMECDEEDGTAVCSTCDTGYYEQDGVCSACVDQCSECYDGDTCRTCQSGTAFSQSETKCVDCPDDCANCGFDSTGTLTCTDCDHGFYLSATGVCASCHEAFPNCAHCNEPGGVFQCLACRTDYVLQDDGTQCIGCDIDDCTMCLDPPPYCSGCSDGYAATEDLYTCDLRCYSCQEDGDQYGCYGEQMQNDSMSVCSGLGSTRSCKVRVWSILDTVQSVSRECSNSTCTPGQTGWDCSLTDLTQECVLCCDGDLCNAEDGNKSGSSRAVLSGAAFAMVGLALWRFV